MIQLAVGIVAKVEEQVRFRKSSAIAHPIRLIKQAEHQLAATRCVTCGAKGSSLEQHHVAGRANRPDSVTLCNACHDEITNVYQVKWLPWQNGGKNSVECYLLGWSDIFHLLWRRTGHQYFYELSKAFAVKARYAR